MFITAKGSGDYLGAAITLPISISGSFGLAEHLGPFVLPVGIKATLRQIYEPADAILHCDFSSGFDIYARSDVRDGYFW